jgi:hypothetical protein
MLCTVNKINRNGKKCRNLSSSKSNRESNRSGPDNGKKTELWFLEQRVNSKTYTRKKDNPMF